MLKKIQSLLRIKFPAITPSALAAETLGCLRLFGVSPVDFIEKTVPSGNIEYTDIAYLGDPEIRRHALLATLTKMQVLPKHRLLYMKGTAEGREKIETWLEKGIS